MAPTIHASAVLVGAHAALIRGPSGSGKSRLALALLEAANRRSTLPFARLVADDRAEVEACHGRLLVRPAPSLAGLIEVRGLGIRRVPYEGVAAVGFVIDLGATDAARLPEPASQTCEIDRISLPRLSVGSDQDPLPLVLLHLQTAHQPA
jgi:serine kinase of HPr protein (carbohydrate metabolism regulator)